MTNWNMRTEELELKDGSTIKNYHYEFNSTDRVLAKIVEDVFKGIMDIKADHKTEPTISKMEQVDEPQKWTKENCKGCKYNEYPYDSGTCFVRVCINGNKYEPKDEQTERSRR